jgi:hypothetical protein
MMAMVMPTTVRTRRCRRRGGGWSRVGGNRDRNARGGSQQRSGRNETSGE